jgi:hypothetical protein
MKNLTFVCCIILFGCSTKKDDPKPIVYSDLRGSWKFELDNISADFEIVGDLNPFYTDFPHFTYLGVYAGGTFTIDGDSYVTENSGIQTFDFDFGYMGDILFWNMDGAIILYDITYTEDFSEISAKSYDFKKDGNDFVSPKVVNVVIKRKV